MDVDARWAERFEILTRFREVREQIEQEKKMLQEVAGEGARERLKRPLSLLEAERNELWTKYNSHFIRAPPS